MSMKGCPFRLFSRHLYRHRSIRVCRCENLVLACERRRRWGPVRTAGTTGYQSDNHLTIAIDLRFSWHPEYSNGRLYCTRHVSARWWTARVECRTVSIAESSLRHACLLTAMQIPSAGASQIYHLTASSVTPPPLNTSPSTFLNLVLRNSHLTPSSPCATSCATRSHISSASSALLCIST